MKTPICQKICVDETNFADVASSGASWETTVKLIGKSAPEEAPMMITPASSIKKLFENKQIAAPIA